MVETRENRGGISIRFRFDNGERGRLFYSINRRNIGRWDFGERNLYV